MRVLINHHLKVRRNRLRSECSRVLDEYNSDGIDHWAEHLA